MPLNASPEVVLEQFQGLHGTSLHGNLMLKAKVPCLHPRGKLVSHLEQESRATKGIANLMPSKRFSYELQAQLDTHGRDIIGLLSLHAVLECPMEYPKVTFPHLAGTLLSERECTG